MEASEWCESGEWPACLDGREAHPQAPRNLRLVLDVQHLGAGHDLLLQELQGLGRRASQTGRTSTDTQKAGEHTLVAPFL